MNVPLTPTRREALVLGAGMAAVAVTATMARPVDRAVPAVQRIDLDAVFPRRFDGWREDALSKAFVRPAEAQGKLYGIYDEVLERTFVDDAGRRIMLSVAYGSDQSTGFQLHRPEGCYEAGGFEVGEVRAGTLMLAGRAVAVTRLRAAKPFRPEPVTYWTVLGGEAIAGRFGFRLKRVFTGLRAQQNLAGMLVRISSIDDDTARAHALQSRFAVQLAAALAPQVREAVLGRAA